MLKTLKEYLGIPTIRVGGLDAMQPMTSLSRKGTDIAPKGKGGRDTRAIGLAANYRGRGVGTYKPMISADTKRIPRKPGQKAGSDKHSDLYTDEDPKGTIHGLGFTDGATARKSVAKIKGSGKTHAHKMQAAIAMSQRAKVASQRAKDPEKKKNLGIAHKIYQNYIDTNKKSKNEIKEELNDLVHKKVAERPVDNVVGDWKNIGVVPPTENDSPETEKEMEEMISLFKKRDEQSVKNHDQDVFYGLREYLKENDLKIDADANRKIIQIGQGVGRYYKNKFERIRPYHLADAMNLKFDHMELISNSMKTPAYPSGHSLQSRLLAEFYAKKYPEHRDELIKKADECGLGRVYAGWHYPSDHTESVKIAKKLINMINIKKD